MSIKGLMNQRPKKIPLDGCEVWVKSPTLGQILRLEEMGSSGDQMGAVREIISKCLVDSDGNRLFTGPDDPELDELPIEVVQLATDIAVNGFNTSGKRIEKN